ncbi:hypothetical protein GF359_01605 [candidate division WOR-3 bacterium]|uniref:DUF2007 domain-containing protein n=1 Tax=candidate division WOR-3 bacterium TaxID=2052148 RepID=A0A9D5K967_UNCW3|nr:hypothetical protein [candidate division WOR-3 bacterium]MBD3363889.1 hypothetical protein [candidate division WOR-3 bacterium]
MSMELVSVLETGDPVFVSMVKSYLDDAGIPYIVQGENLRGLVGASLFSPSNPILAPVVVKVRTRDAGRALEIIEDLNKRYKKEPEGEYA